MKFSLNLPIAIIEPQDEFNTGEAVREMAVAIESAGGDACWVIDHPAPDIGWLRHPRGHDAVDPFIALTYAAAVTTRLRLQTNVLVLPYRNPFLTAKAVTTLERLSGGRTILGVGSGYMEGEFSALGVDFRKRGAMMDEALETMALAWSGEVVVKRGLTFDAKGNLPRPAPPRPPTVWIGGAADRVLQRVVKWGSGWSPFFAPTGDAFRDAQRPLTSLADLKARIGLLQEMMAKAGRSDPLDVCLNMPEPPRGASRAEADRCVQALGELAEIGVTWIFATPEHPSRAGFVENVRWFGEEVMARARG
jgi:probable F420-dependent oxidoreductase